MSESSYGKFRDLIHRLWLGERIALLIAVILFLFGIFHVVHPSEMIVEHTVIKGVINPIPSGLEYVSKGRCQFYGAIMILMGLGLAYLALYSILHRRK